MACCGALACCITWTMQASSPRSITGELTLQTCFHNASGALETSQTAWASHTWAPAGAVVPVAGGVVSGDDDGVGVVRGTTVDAGARVSVGARVLVDGVAAGEEPITADFESSPRHAKARSGRARVRNRPAKRFMPPIVSRRETARMSLCD